MDQKLGARNINQTNESGVFGIAVSPRNRIQTSQFRWFRRIPSWPSIPEHEQDGSPRSTLSSRNPRRCAPPATPWRFHDPTTGSAAPQFPGGSSRAHPVCRRDPTRTSPEGHWGFLPVAACEMPRRLGPGRGSLRSWPTHLALARPAMPGQAPATPDGDRSDPSGVPTISSDSDPEPWGYRHMVGADLRNARKDRDSLRPRGETSREIAPTGEREPRRPPLLPGADAGLPGHGEGTRRARPGTGPPGRPC